MLGFRTLFRRLLDAYRLKSAGLLLAAMSLILLLPVALLIDVPLARYCLADHFPGDLQRVLQWSEVAAHGLGVAILMAVIYVMDIERRRLLPRAIAATVAAGLIADIGKLLVARARPRVLPPDSTVWDSFRGWCPVLFPVEGNGVLDSDWMSFPSGHSAVAAAFAVGLIAIYPRARYLLTILAFLAILQRVESGAHYLSDVLAGAALGLLMAAAFHSPSPISRYFDRRFGERPA